MPFDMLPETTTVNQHALERARMLRSLGNDFRAVAVGIRPFCKSMRERDDVLMLAYS